MECPNCLNENTFVTAVERHKQAQKTRRYRRCDMCGTRFRTTQYSEVVDDDGELWRAAVPMALRQPANKRRRHQVQRLKGVDSPVSFFTKQNIIDIREQGKTGDFSFEQLATLYGCSKSTIRRIVRRERYKEIP
ncbi:MAG: hypothetical protein VW840_14190 [Gammaproteobacteria bacterium]